MLLSFIATLGLATIASAGGACPVANSFCIYGEPNQGGKTVYTVHAAGTGWYGIGTGSSMRGSNMFIFWSNSTGGVVVSPRSSSGHSLPAYNSQSLISVTDLKVPAPAWAKMAVSFVADTYTGTTWNWGTGSSAPTSNDPSSSFKRHDDFGTMNADFATAGANITSNANGAPGSGGRARKASKAGKSKKGDDDDDGDEGGKHGTQGRRQRTQGQGGDDHQRGDRGEQRSKQARKD